MSRDTTAGKGPAQRQGSKSAKSAKESQNAAESKSRQTRPPPNTPPPPSAASLATAEGRCGEAIRLYLLLNDRELEASEVSRRVNVLQVIHGMASAELEKRVQELEKRLVEAGKMPRKVAYSHE